MSRPKRRIELNPKQENLHAAFANLTVPDVAAAPATCDVPRPNGPPPPLWKMGRVVLRKETAHRGGKTVIVVHDFATHLPLTVIEAVAKKLRAACGCGGAVKGRTIELQGDQPQKIRALLEAEGFQVAGVR
jgi:translation initiation factor 1